MHVTIVVGNGTCVAGCKRIEVDIGAEVIKISVERSLFIVVAHFAPDYLCMPDCKIEDTRM